MTEKEVFIAACGVDDDQNNKSIVKIESKIFHTKNSTEEDVSERTIDGPVVNIFRSMRYTMIDLQFSDNSDYDYINVSAMLKDFCTPGNSIDDLAEDIPAIVLTVMPKSLEGEYYICGMHGTWCLMPSQPNRLADTIRFIFDNNLVHTYQIDESQVDTDELIEEAYLESVGGGA